MPQINLLGQDTARGGSLTKAPLYAVRFFILLFVLLLAFWGYLLIRTRMATKRVGTVQAHIIATQKEILANQNRRELLVRQGQLQAADGLIKDHKYWSRLLPELARVTLKNASYISFSADNSGLAHLAVTVPSYKDFDLFLQVFDLPEFNDRFSNITVSTVGKYQQSDTQSVRFDIALRYDPEFLKTQEATDRSALLK